jgi:dTMP kinase
MLPIISFEGIDCSGKSTQIKKTGEWLESLGYTVHIFQEPGTTELGLKLRELLRNAPFTIAKRAELFLFCAARVELLIEKVIPLQNELKTIVLLDRYIDSSTVYQGIGMDEDFPMKTIHDLTIGAWLPIRTFVFTLNLETYKQRKKNRKVITEDRFETELEENFNLYSKAYSNLWNNDPERIHNISSSDYSIETVQEIIQADLTNLFKKNDV